MHIIKLTIITIYLLTNALFTLAEERQSRYQVYEVVFNTMEVNQYKSYEDPRWNYALYRKKVAPTYSFPVKVNDVITATFEYSPDAVPSHFKSGVSYYFGGIGEFQIEGNGLSISASNSELIGVDRYDWHSVYAWNQIDSLVLGDIPFGLSISAINLQLRKTYNTVTYSPYVLETILSLDYFDRGMHLWLWFNNKEIDGFEGFTEQLIYAQATELRKLSDSKLESYCIMKGFATPACDQGFN